MGTFGWSGFFFFTGREGETSVQAAPVDQSTRISESTVSARQRILATETASSLLSSTCTGFTVRYCLVFVESTPGGGASGVLDSAGDPEIVTVISFASAGERITPLSP